MKIWQSFSAEHSARLKIIGTFKTQEDAEAAESLFNGLLAVEDRYSNTPDVPGKSFSKGMLDYLMANELGISPKDLEQLEYLEPIKAEGNTIEVSTDDWAIHILLQALVHYGAKVEVYSRHDY